MLLLLPLGTDEAVHLLVLPHARGELGPQVDEGLLTEMDTVSSAKGQAVIAWGRAGWRNCEGYPYPDSKDQGQVLHDEAQHTPCTFSILALETGPEQKFRDFFAHSPRKASTMAGKENFVTFHLCLSQGKSHQESCHTPYNFCIFSNPMLVFAGTGTGAKQECQGPSQPPGTPFCRVVGAGSTAAP